MLTIDMNAAPTHIRAYLRLDGDQPSPEIVEIQNLDHFYGVTRKGAGDTERAEHPVTRVRGPDRHPVSRRHAHGDERPCDGRGLTK